MKVLDICIVVIISVLMLLFLIPGEKTFVPSIKGAEQIPDVVYKNTFAGDKFYEILSHKQSTKYIFWAASDSPENQKIDRDINSLLEMNDLTKNYERVGKLMKGGFSISCYNQTMQCVEPYLYDNCSDNICIINPSNHEIVKVPNSNQSELEKFLLQMKDL